LKKPVTIFFLLLLFFSQVGYYFYYLFQQYEIREAVKHEFIAKLPESSLEKIDAVAFADDIEWEDEGREFYLNGQLYDVAYIKNVNGKKLIYCLNDKKEEQHLKDLAHAVNSGNEQNSSNKNGHHSIKFEPSDFIILTENKIFIGQPAIKKHVDHTVALISNVKQVFTPPPDLMQKNKT
jgi:hypothetical protein